MMVPGMAFLGPRKRRPRLNPVRAPEMVEARTLSEGEGSRSWRGWRGAPRVMFHQFRRPVWLRIVARVPQKVAPMANHWAPETMAKRAGVWVRRVP